MELHDTTVIVTGAAQGIGKCIAQTLAADGASLFLVDIEQDKLEAVAKEIRETGINVATSIVDIAEPSQTKGMAEAILRQFGRIDALVNNAGIDCPHGKAWEIGESHWQRIIDVNLSGAWWCSRSVIPHMMERGGGKIIIISSASARTPGKEESPAYPAAKAGLIGLTMSLSVQLESFGILVNAIAPGPTGNTGTPFPEGKDEEYLEQFPLGFVGPQPVADGVRYLLRESGDWISGAVLNISGGAVRGL